MRDATCEILEGRRERILSLANARHAMLGDQDQEAYNEACHSYDLHQSNLARHLHTLTLGQDCACSLR